ATARLNIEDSTLSSAVDLLQRARELAVQGNNGTQSAADRKAIATEVRQLADSMMGLANTKDANGEYLFAGYKTQQQPFSSNGAGPYTYNGDQGQRSVQIGPTRQVATSDSGQDVFMNVPGGSGSVFSMLNKLASDMESNSPDPSSITDMDAAINNLSSVRAAVGARLNAIDLQKNANDSVVLQYQTTRSNIQDLDYASAISQLNLQMTGLQAAQQSYVKVQGLSLFNYLR
ncbi:MAG: flagellar hook-associated protein FlgL, partial [Pseudolabrys sp.]